MRRFIAALCLCLVTSAAFAQPGVRSTRSGGKTVCVASALGHTFGVQKIGLMVFGNSLAEVTVAGWGIDDAAVRKTSQILGKQFNVRRIYLSKDWITKFETPGALFRNPFDDLLAALRATAARAGRCDFYVTLIRGRSAYANTNQTVAGLGILDNSVVVDRVFVFADFIIRIYDGKTFEVLKTAGPRTDPIGSLFGAGIRAMYRRVDKAWWPPTPGAAVKNDRIRNVSRELVEQGLAKTLPGML